MSLAVLKSRGDVTVARREMHDRGIDCADRAIIRFLKRWHLLPGIILGDPVKSWDILKTVEFLEERIARDAPVVDLGAYASEILPALHRLNYTGLTGIDLNPRLPAMPHGDYVKYMVGDIYRTGFADASFAAITAISVIEHGFDAEGLLTEVSRLLKPGGYFVASVDYWPEKIDTRGVTAFGMDWMIFSREELESFFAMASDHGLELCGSADYEAGEPTVKWLGKSYTFAWLALKKIGRTT